MEQIKLKAVILGGTGAVGRELVKQLCESGQWGQVTLITRSVLDQWKPYIENKKLNIIQVETLDKLEQTEQWKDFQGYNSMFSCLGGRVKMGDDVFTKIDYYYQLWGAQIAKQNGIPHFGLVSTQRANEKSSFLFMRVKGQIETAIRNLQLPYYSIYKPGALLNREHDERMGEKLVKYIPFLDKISTIDTAKAIRIESETIHLQNKINLSKFTNGILWNKDLKRVSKENKY